MQELSWAAEIASNPDFICQNWQALGTGGEAYVKNFGSLEETHFRVMVCKVVGKHRELITIFPRGHIGDKELGAQMAIKNEGAATAARSTEILALGWGIADLEDQQTSPI
jgi:hypothetical protein